MKYIFIINPHAGNGGAVQQIREQMKVLSEAERSMCSLYETKGEGDATFYVRKYLAENQGEAVRFIACGGAETERSTRLWLAQPAKRTRALRAIPAGAAMIL